MIKAEGKVTRREIRAREKKEMEGRDKKKGKEEKKKKLKEDTKTIEEEEVEGEWMKQKRRARVAERESFKWTCDCGRRFRRRNDLTRHMKTCAPAHPEVDLRDDR